ncbi:MAG: ribonuclease Z [Pseudoflavonifractor sp.]|nr:ribonuclease Z [Alloprevotella sp.]MCM1117442.1 ribonuclease Z [Pseudoflavonifractor sp.]
MDRFDVTILGCGSATPTLRHHPSAQALTFRGRVMLIDCGEGTQLQMRRFSIPFSRLTDIFISHLHGDHCLGLPGLLSSLSLVDASQPVTVHIPAHGLDIFTRMLKFFCPGASGIILRPIPGGTNVIADMKGLTVTAFPLYHRIPAFGFRFDEKPRERRLRGDLADSLAIPPSLRKGIKNGASWRRPSDGRVFSNEELTLPPPPSLSYAYCSDTVADTRVARAVEGVDLLYHEATYTDDMAALAHERGHSTAAEAGRIAAEAAAKALMIGHYSKRYADSAPLVAEAAAAFRGPVIASNEGMTIDIASASRPRRVEPTKAADIRQILAIFSRAKERMRAGGNTSQWAGAYPAEADIRADIAAGQSYVVRGPRGIEGTFVIKLLPEPTYAVIDGSWLSDSPYVTIHRIAALAPGLGIADACLSYIRAQWPGMAIRIDTHADNRPMLSWIRARGFTYCGEIRLADGSPRLAFQL